jgi:hypothetical protein
MDTTEMADIPQPVQLLSKDRESCSLLKVEAGGRGKVTSSQKVAHFGTDIEIHFAEDFGNIPF